MLDSISSDDIKIISSDINNLVNTIFDFVKYKTDISFDDVNKLVDDADTFTKCFNTVNKLDIFGSIKVWKQYDSDLPNVYKIKCSSLDNYINSTGINFTICNVDNDFVIFEAWHLMCCNKYR